MDSGNEQRIGPKELKALQDQYRKDHGDDSLQSTPQVEQTPKDTQTQQVEVTQTIS